MVDYIVNVIFIALLSSFVILLIGKVGAREHIIINGNFLLSKLFSCDFCLSFWVSLFISVTVSVATNDMTLLFAPLFSTPITRILI